MNAPQGWQQRPPQPPGWHPPPSHQPPPGWHGHPPKKKSKAPLIIGLVVVAFLMLGGLATGAVFYVIAHEDQGEPARSNAIQPELCRKVSEQTLAALRTTNTAVTGSNERDTESGKHTNCNWVQTKGRDGDGMRKTKVTVEQVESEETAELSYKSRGTIGTVKNIAIGDEGMVMVIQRGNAEFEVRYFVRDGGTLFTIEYNGWDAGLFSRTKPDTAEMETTAKPLLDELMGDL